MKERYEAKIVEMRDEVKVKMAERNEPADVVDEVIYCVYRDTCTRC